jgi:hypothetical protein
MHVDPQLRPAGVLVTVPRPLPASCTVSCTGTAAALVKVAVTDVAAVGLTVHAAMPLHPPPDHPANTDPELGVAARLIEEPLAKLALHVEPQLIPAGVLVTVPVPLPALVTVSFMGAGPLDVNVAVTDAEALSAMVHVAVPLQPPDHPPNVEPALGAAVSVTEVPVAKVALQVEPQLIPAGLLLIIPAPLPALVIVSSTFLTIVVVVDEPQPKAKIKSAELAQRDTAFFTKRK